MVCAYFMKTCLVCGVPLIENNPNNRYGTKDGEDYISMHHLFPKRLKKYFKNLEEIKKLFGLKNINATACLCYVCHEEILHNVVFNEEMIEDYARELRGKCTKEMAVRFHTLLKNALSKGSTN